MAARAELRTLVPSPPREHPMATESWVHYHQQRMLAGALEGARRAALARQGAVARRGLRPRLAAGLVLLATRLDDRPQAAPARSGHARIPRSQPSPAE